MHIGVTLTSTLTDHNADVTGGFKAWKVAI